MSRYLLAFTLVLAIVLLALAQRTTTATLQEDAPSLADASLVGPSPTATATNINTYFPVFRVDATPVPPTATPAPTATPTPTSLYPRSPWLLQLGSTQYIHNDFMHWLEGDIYWPNGDPIEGFHVQICRADGSACSGPSSGTGANGHYDHVRYDGGRTKGDYYTVVVDCTNTVGDPGNSTIGHWPACEEHSERVYFEMDIPEKAIANVKWVLVDPEQN